MISSTSTIYWPGDYMTATTTTARGYGTGLLYYYPSSGVTWTAPMMHESIRWTPPEEEPPELPQ